MAKLLSSSRAEYSSAAQDKECDVMNGVSLTAKAIDSEVVLEPVVEKGENELVIDQVMGGVFEGAGLDLLVKVNGDEFPLAYE